MEFLPSEPIALIFHFLPGYDVARCKRLSSWIKNIIEQNQETISRPEVKVSLSGLIYDSYFWVTIQAEKELELPSMEIRNKFTRVCIARRHPFYRSFFGDAKEMSIDHFFYCLLEKGDIHLCVESPLNEFHLKKIDEVILRTNCKFSRITLNLGLKDSDQISFNLVSIASKLKKIPPLRIITKGLPVNYDWIKVLLRLGHVFTNISFYTSDICLILELIVKGIHSRPDEPISFYIEYNDTNDVFPNACNLPWVKCGFRSRATDCMKEVVKQLPKRFLMDHTFANMPQMITFSLPGCVLKLKKLGCKIYIEKEIIPTVPF